MKRVVEGDRLDLVHVAGVDVLVLLHDGFEPLALGVVRVADGVTGLREFVALLVQTLLRTAVLGVVVAQLGLGLLAKFVFGGGLHVVQVDVEDLGVDLCVHVALAALVVVAVVAVAVVGVEVFAVLLPECVVRARLRSCLTPDSLNIT